MNKRYEALVRLEFSGYIEVEAKDAEEASNKIWAMLERNEIDPFNDFEPSTEVIEIEEI